MTKRTIRICLSVEGNVVLKNENGKEIVILITQKQLEAKDVYDLLDYTKGDKYHLEGEEKYSDEVISGPKNDKYRLYNFTYEYMEELFKKLNEFQIESWKCNLNGLINQKLVGGFW